MISWKCKHTWKKSAVNTSWCLLGCSIGDFSTILYFQLNPSDWTTMSIMMLAMMNGLLTSIALETYILTKQMDIKSALQTALGMSFISMIAMEASMNIVDVLLTGGAELNIWVVPIMLIAGFLTPWPYNYWRLKKYNASCH
ncbi:MAG: DUF4396 domain-containing protein [Candidatus Marinimicrobia bacterium]|jgi:hypothetical protein|nr:DUF4396 domain-containing protein [Candidatus Neomarinimicrobiota bacterium]|tara:strand:- start:1831 stop:2253 length:423 start_codon:yes stop_codon:yes gene_type:complete